jgi:hypothetical protein
LLIGLDEDVHHARDTGSRAEILADESRAFSRVGLREEVQREIVTFGIGDHEGVAVGRGGEGVHHRRCGIISADE